MITTSKNMFINIKKKEDEMVSYFLGINISIIMASRKANVKEKAIYFGIPGSRSLLKAI